MLYSSFIELNMQNIFTKHSFEVVLQTEVKHMNGVVYARYSSDNQREESIEGQMRECKEFAEKNGLKKLL